MHHSVRDRLAFAAEKDGGDGGFGKDCTAVDDNDTRRKRQFQVQARSDRQCGTDPRERELEIRE